MNEDIILVDDQDNAIGTMEKMEVHRKGVLHRAFSVLVFNSDREMLLQKRSLQKYHSAGLWTNTCCSHPRPDESMAQATRQRLRYEMGIDIQPEFSFKFIYRADLDHHLVEHELDHVFTATFDGIPVINKEEVEAWKFVSLKTLRHNIVVSPEHYTAWLKLIVNHPQFDAQISRP